MEIPFVFGTVDMPDVAVFTGRNPQRFALADHVMDAWIGFARSGDPTPPGGPRWPTYDPSRRATMELGETLQVVDDPLSAQRKAWGGAVPSKDMAWELLQVN
jgi:para-nitrobenzyl esterase